MTEDEADVERKDVIREMKKKNKSKVAGKLGTHCSSLGGL